MIQTLVDLTGNLDAPHLLLNNGFGLSSSFGLNLGKFAPNDYFKLTPLMSNLQPPQMDSVMQGWINGDQFILGGRATGENEFSVNTFDINGKQIGETENYGEQASMFTGYTKVGGGVIGITYVDPQRLNPKESVNIFDIAYKFGGGHPLYTTRLPKYPSMFPVGNIALSAKSLRCVEFPEGTVWCFYEADSSQRIGLLKLNCILRTVSPISFTETFVGPPPNDPIPPQMNPSLERCLSPSGEFARLTAIYDNINNRILLAYQQWDWREVVDPTYPINRSQFYSRWTVVEVKEDGKPKCIGLSPWWDQHSANNSCILLPLPNGEVYFLGHYQNIDPLPGESQPNWETGFRGALIKDGKFNLSNDRLPKGKMISYSNNGYAVYQNHIDYTTSLIKVSADNGSYVS